MDFGKLLLKIVDVAKEYMDSSKNAAPSTQQTRTTQQQPQQQSYSSDEEIYRTPDEWKAYFKQILQSEFPSYTIRENVKVTDLAGNVSDEFKLYKTRPNQVYRAEWGQPYTFVLDNGASKAVVMLGDGHSHDSNVKYLIARMFAKKMDIPYINFYTQMGNQRSYVVERIRKFLK